MKQYIKGYHMFLPKVWVKWCVYVFYPLLVIGGLGLLNRCLMYYSFICIGFACSLIVLVEYALDYFVFGGIASKNTNRLEYLKTSVRGVPLLKKVLVTDACRRFLSTAVILFGTYFVLTPAYRLNGRQTFICVLLTFLLVEAGFMISRFFIHMGVNLLVLTIINSLVFIVAVGLVECNVRIWTIFALMFAAAGVAVMGRRLIIHRVRRSFYDK